MMRVARQIASVWTMYQPFGRVVEACLLHHPLAVEGPALAELGGAAEEADEARVGDRGAELEVVAGVGLVDADVLLIDARLCSRIISGDDGGVTMYVPTGLGSNLAGS